MPPIILCLASYFKGGLFVEECKRQGAHTILITTQKQEHEEWPRHAIDEFFMLPFPNLARQPDITHSIGYLLRDRAVDRIVALDDYDVETAADLREHFRLPGIGASTSALFPRQAGHAPAHPAGGRAGAGLYSHLQLRCDQ